MTDTVSTFRRKSIEVEAEQWFKPGDHPSVERWSEGTDAEIAELNRTMRCGCGCGMGDHGLIASPTGPMRVCPGDWIVMEVPMLFADPLTTYPVQAAVFERAFERKTAR